MNLNIERLKNTESGNFFLIAGPCVIENEEMPFEIAEKILEITNKYKIPFIFKASYKKANRSRIDSFTGIGDEKALRILKQISEKYDIPVITDIHSVEEATIAANYVDILQIPAFLCRQTDLLIAAAKTNKWVNIKKGQFLAPDSMKYAAQKVIESGNDKVMITDRGTMFGYQDIIVDYTGIPILQSFGHPVILDITHSLQKPNQSEGISGGRPKMIETIAKAGIAVGVDGIFIETHPDPINAKSDGANMLNINSLDSLLNKLIELRKNVNNFE